MPLVYLPLVFLSAALSLMLDPTVRKEPPAAP